MEVRFIPTDCTGLVPASYATSRLCCDSGRTLNSLRFLLLQKRNGATRRQLIKQGSRS